MGYASWVIEDTKKFLRRPGLHLFVDFMVLNKPIRLYFWKERKHIPEKGANACFTYKHEESGERVNHIWWGMMHFNMEDFGARSWGHEVYHLSEHLRLSGAGDEEEIATAIGEFGEAFWAWFEQVFERSDE